MLMESHPGPCYQCTYLPAVEGQLLTQRPFWSTYPGQRELSCQASYPLPLGKPLDHDQPTPLPQLGLILPNNSYSSSQRMGMKPECSADHILAFGPPWPHPAFLTLLLTTCPQSIAQEPPFQALLLGNVIQGSYLHNLKNFTITRTCLSTIATIFFTQGNFKTSIPISKIRQTG